MPRYIPEYEKVFRIREALRAKGYLPESATDEFVTAVQDGERNGWYSSPLGRLNGEERRAEAWLLAWVRTPVPTAHLEAREWVEVLREASSVTKLDVSLRSETIELYRGAVDGDECGLSWTTSKSVAVFFSLRQLPRGVVGKVFRAKVPRKDVLADLRRLSVTEQEVIVDPLSITAEEVRMDESSRRYWHGKYVKEMKRLAIKYGEDVLEGVPEEYPTTASGDASLSPQQSLDPYGKNYTPKVYTPSVLRWPLVDEVRFIQLGDVLVTRIAHSVGWSV